MSVAFDTNVLIYAASQGEKGDVARRLLDAGGRLGVQVLNEFANVALRKLRLDWPAINELLLELQRRCGPIAPLTLQIHHAGLSIAERYRLSVYDALIVAAAIDAGCDTLYSEDMHHGLVIDGRLTITNPFHA